MKYHKHGGSDVVVPLRPRPDPASGVVRVARKISSETPVSAFELQTKLVHDLSTAALAGYEAAREAITDGDTDRATALVQKAAKALEMASEIAAEIASV